MCAESIANEDFPTAFAEEIVPRSPWRASAVEALSGFRLRVTFVDGLIGFVDLSRLIHSEGAGVFAKLADPVLFEQVRLDYGAVAWPGDLDLAPDAMYEAIRKHGAWLL